MKKRFLKIFVIPLATAVLASCAGEEISSTSTSSTTSDVTSSETTSSSSESTSTSTAVEVTGITLDQTEVSLKIGETATLTATVAPDDATDKTVTWTTSDEAIATVADGVVTAVAEGTATITATAGEKTATCTVTVQPDTYTFALASGEATDRAYNYDDVQEDTVTFDIQKNGAAWADGTVEAVENDDAGVISAVTQDADNNNKYIVTFSGTTGTASVDFTLKDHTDLGTVTINYTITEYFLNQTIKRGTNVEADGKITMDGSAQHTAVTKKADTNWVLKATLTFPKYAESDRSVGLGGFLDQGDHAVWFGFRNHDGAADSYGGIYTMDFYSGWASRNDNIEPEAYKKVKLSESEDGNYFVLPCTVIREGTTYYFDIDGYHDKYTSTYEAASYPGFFSQAEPLTITDYSVEYGADAVTAAKGTTYEAATATIDAGIFVDANTNELVREASRTFEVATAPTYAEETYSLVADSTYADYVTIDGTTVTINSDAPAGDMTLTLTTASGKALDTVTVPVVEESSEASNELLTVKGGVVLNDDGSIVFPTTKTSTDGVGGDSYYDTTKEYGATLNNRVLGGAFTLEFDVENYVSTVQYPKLMVSVGGAASQFYIAYNYNNGTTSRIETNTRSSQYYGNQWNNSVDFTDFDATAKHHYKIVSTGGYYHFYLDNSETELSMQCDGDARNILVPMETYYTMVPIRFSTNGVSAKISNITVTSGTLDSTDTLHTFGTRATSITNGVQSTFPLVTSSTDSWCVRYTTSEGMFASSLFADAYGAYTATFNVTFSKMMSDGKLGIVFAGNTGDTGAFREFHICNASSPKVENYNGAWGGPSISDINLSSTNLTLPITLVNDGNGSVTLTTTKSDGTTSSITDTGINPTSGIYFWTFNSTSADADTTVQITDVTITRS